jgi:hypothetical protein
VVLELSDGRVVVTYDNETFEILEICDWHGNDLTDTHWDTIAQDHVANMVYDLQTKQK